MALRVAQQARVVQAGAALVRHQELALLALLIQAAVVVAAMALEGLVDLAWSSFATQTPLQRQRPQQALLLSR